VVVVGGGVVGLSCAYFLSQRFSVLLVERHPSFGWETSSRNSEVIHSGIYYPAGTLKAKLCVEGNRSIYHWCQQYNVPYKNVGKLIVATEEEEVGYLENLMIRAEENGVADVHFLSAQEIRQLEPNVNAIAALWVKTTGILDSHRLMDSLYANALHNSCDFAFRHTVVSIDKVGEQYIFNITNTDGEIFNITSRFVVNSAGLESDRIFSLLGVDVDKLGYTLQWAKGNYFRIRPSKSNLASRLIYPVPPADSSFLGIHLTVELDGNLKLGPDLVYLDNRIQDYSVSEELRDKFYRSAAKYLRGLEPEDLQPDQAGIRPKLKSFKEYPDFIIKEESENDFPGFINLIGIESPGLTCCLEIGKMVNDIIQEISN